MFVNIISCLCNLLCNVLALYEAALGFMQVLGLRASGHAAFAMTGSFANPGPYGGLMAVLLVVTGAYFCRRRDSSTWYGKALSLMSAVSCALCFIVLPASMSRSAWLAAGVASAVFGFREMQLGEWVKTHGTHGMIAVIALVLLMAGAFFIKKDSAIGRLHIWHMELRAIAESPWTGHGSGSVLGVYGDVQADYFARKQRPEIITKVAGCPEYAFNEYLKVGVEHGIPAMAAVIAVLGLSVVFLLKFRSPLAYGLIAFGVFAFFSYPLEAVSIRSPEEKEWESMRHLSGVGLYEDAVEEFAPLYEDLKDNYRYLYDYGYALHKCGRYEESTQILKQGTAISSDPMFYNIIGRNHEALGLYRQAEEAYLHAHHMVPCRLYPLVLLMEMSVSVGDPEKAHDYGMKALQTPINENHRNMVMLRDRAKACCDTLK